MSFILAIVIPLIVGFSRSFWMPFDYLNGSLKIIGYLFPMYWINNITYNVMNGDTIIFLITMALALTVFYFILASLLEKLNRTNQVHSNIE